MAYKKGPIKRRYFNSLFNSSPAQSQSEPFLKARLPRATDSQEACSRLTRGLGEPRAKCASYHSTKSRVGGKVGTTTIYKQLKSIHTSGSDRIIFRAMENTARVCPVFASLSPSWPFCYQSYLLPEPLAIATSSFQNCTIAVTLREV